jgi:hypothetical protein
MLSYQPVKKINYIKFLKKSTMCFITMDPNNILQQLQLLAHAPKLMLLLLPVVVLTAAPFLI